MKTNETNGGGGWLSRLLQFGGDSAPAPRPARAEGVPTQGDRVTLDSGADKPAPAATVRTAPSASSSTPPTSSSTAPASSSTAATPPAVTAPTVPATETAPAVVPPVRETPPAPAASTTAQTAVAVTPTTAPATTAAAPNPAEAQPAPTPEKTEKPGFFASLFSTDSIDSRAAEQAQNKPVIAILLDGRPGASENFNRDSGPVYMSGGRTMQYADAVKDAGGYVRWVWDDGRSIESQLEGAHGVLVPGGRDINPELYGQRARLGVPLNLTAESFDKWECQVIETTVKNGVPLRGICRGMQLMNIVGLGGQKGTLMQDISNHMNRPWGYTQDHRSSSHMIAILPETVLANQVGMDTLKVNSSHHQAVDAVAEGYAPTAYSADGVVEAMEAIGRPELIGVQFHPERLQGDKASEFKRRFFSAFVEQAEKVRVKSLPNVGRGAAASSTKPAAPAPTATPAPATAPPPAVASISAASRPAPSVAPRAATPEPPAQAPRASTTEQPATTAVRQSLVGFERSKLDAMLDGLKVLDDAKYQLRAGSVRLDRSNLEQSGVHGQFKDFGLYGELHPNVCLVAMKPQRAEEFLLSMTDEGRRLLPPATIQGLQLIHRARNVNGQGARISERFCIRTPGQTGPIDSVPTSEIELTWACASGNLVMRYNDPKTGNRTEYDIDSLPTFEKAVGEMEANLAPAASTAPAK